MSGAEWTSLELKVLRARAIEGAAVVLEAINELRADRELPPRTLPSVQRAAYRYRVSLRRRDRKSGKAATTRGPVLGQPRGVSLVGTRVREAIVTGEVDPELVVKRLELEGSKSDPLCPACGTRPVKVRTTGMCIVCHKRKLTEAHNEAIAEIIAQRDLWTARKQLQRLREDAAGEVST